MVGMMVAMALSPQSRDARHHAGHSGLEFCARQAGTAVGGYCFCECHHSSDHASERYSAAGETIPNHLPRAFY